MATAPPSTGPRVAALALVLGLSCTGPTPPATPDAAPLPPPQPSPPPVATATAAEIPPSTPPPPVVPADVDPKERRAVIAYFDQIEAIDGGPEKKAHVEGLMQDALAKEGDFTSLITELFKIEGQLRKVPPPKSCQAFHAAKLKLTVDTRAAVEELHRAIAARDQAAIEALGQKGPANEAEITRVDGMRAEILKRFGI